MKLVRIESDYSLSAQRHGQFSVGDLSNRAQLAILYFRPCKGSAKLDSVSFGKAPLRLFVNGNTRESFRVVGNLAPAFEADCDGVVAVVAIQHSTIFTGFNAIYFAALVVTNNVFARHVS